MHNAKITIIADQIMSIKGDDVNIHHLKSITVYGDTITDYYLKPTEQIDREESELAEKLSKKEEIMTQYILKKGYTYQASGVNVLNLPSGITVNLLQHNKERDWIQIEYDFISVQIELHEDEFDDWLEEMPAEEKVLTTDQIITNASPFIIDPDKLADFALPLAYVVKAVTFSHENGRFERDLELRPLIDAVQRYIDDDDIQFYDSGISEALENLKPLKDEI